MKKASIQVSAGFLVMLILALISLGLGVTILYDIIDDAVRIKKGIDEGIKRKIENTLTDPGKNIAIPINKVKVNKGSSLFGLGKNKETLAFGVKNSLKDTTEFKIETECLKAYDSEDDVICNDDNVSNPCDGCDTWIINTQADWTIEVPKRELEMRQLFINVAGDAESGRYTYNLKVKKHPCANPDDCIYDTPKPFYLTVN